MTLSPALYCMKKGGKNMDLSKEKPFSGVLATNQKLWNQFQKEKANVVAKMNEYDLSIKELAIQMDQLEKIPSLSRCFFSFEFV